MIQLIPDDEIVYISQWKPIIKSYRYEMEPTDKQEIKLIKTIDICRNLYNWGLEDRKNAWENNRLSVKYNHQQDCLPILKEENKELKSVHSQVLEDALKRLDKTYANFYRRDKENKENPKKYKKPGHARFKSRNRYKSFTYPQYGNGCHIVNKYGKKDLKGDFVRLSKIGDIKFIKHIDIEGLEEGFSKIKTVTIKREVDKWIFIPTVETFVEIPTIPKEITCIGNREKEVINIKEKDIKTIDELSKTIEELNKQCIGNDMGLPSLITDSNGEQIEAPKYLEKSSKRLRKEQQNLARKKIYDEIDKNGEIKRDPKNGKKLWKGSKNRDKQVEKVAKVHRHIANQRRNSNHIISKRKVKDNDLNVFERLNIQRMMKDRRYSRGIADSGWSQVQMYTSYKAEWAGKKVDFVDPAYTSKVCSRCGRFVGETEGEIFRCPFCHLTINIHINAARNIRNRSEVYGLMVDKMIYQRLSKELKDNITSIENRLKINIYCWSKDPEDSWSNDNRISRDAAARIYAFGEVTSTHMETCEQATSMNQEALPSKKDGSIGDTSIQVPPFRAGS